MKANGIKALDYQEAGEDLVLTLGETTLEDIIKMEEALLRISTDDGHPVEAFSGYHLARVIYEAGSGTYRVILKQGAADTTATALNALTKALAEAEAQLNEQADALVELAGIVAGGGENNG